MRTTLIALALVAAGWLGHGTDADCPTEDSCQPVYENGEWTIVEVTP